MIAVHDVLNAPAYRVLHYRTVEEIQKKIIEKRERNRISRLANAKSDKESIVTWRSNLNTFLHVFNVCLVVAARIPLTIHSQTELAFTTHAMVSEIRGIVVGGQERADNQHRSVSDICTLFHHRMNKQLPPRHQQGQQPRPPMNPTSYICI